MTNIPSCALTPAELDRQFARQRALAPSVASLDRDGALLTVAFREGYDRRALDEMIAIERACCPFFTFAFDDVSRTLTIGVGDEEQAPALSALAHQLGAAA